MTLEISSQSGILPISEKWQPENRAPGVLEWSLPGHGQAYYDCGDLRFRGCLHGEDHPGSLEDPGRQGKAFVQGYYRSCGRKECPTCYESWAGLEAKRSEYRLLSYSVPRGTVREIFSITDDDRRRLYIDRAFRSAKRKPIHVIFSIPEWESGLDIRALRPRLYKLAKKSGLFGGCSIFHPWRERENGSWRFSPHFHVLGFGWIRRVKSLFEESGWIIKNKGVRKSVHATIMYQLSHCGVHREFHVVTWFGGLCYRKLKVDPIPEITPICPLCDRPLIEVFYVGAGLDPPEEEGEYFLPVEDWREKGCYEVW